MTEVTFDELLGRTTYAPHCGKCNAVVADEMAPHRACGCPGDHDGGDVWCEACGHGLPQALEDDGGFCPCCNTYLPDRGLVDDDEEDA